MRRAVVVATGVGALLLALAVAYLADDSVEEPGITIGAVTQLRDASHTYQVLIYSGDGDIDELLSEERTLEEGPVPGLSYLLFDGLDCSEGEVSPLDLPARSRFTVRRDPVVLFSSPSKLQAVDDVVANCAPLEPGS